MKFNQKRKETEKSKDSSAESSLNGFLLFNFLQT